MENNETNTVLITPRMLIFKALGGFKNEEEAIAKATAVEIELIEFMKWNQVTLQIDIHGNLQFKPLLSSTEESSINSDEIRGDV